MNAKVLTISPVKTNKATISPVKTNKAYYFRLTIKKTFKI